MEAQELIRQFIIHQFNLNCILGDNNIDPVTFEKTIKL